MRRLLRPPVQPAICVNVAYAGDERFQDWLSRLAQAR
jgi:hypothetical protein